MDHPVSVSDERSRVSPWILALGLTILAAALFAATALPGVGWGDIGNAQLRVHLHHVQDRVDLSRSHVAYYLLAIPLTSTGLTGATAATTASVVAGSLTVGGFAYLLAMLGIGRAATCLACIMLMLSHALWHLATIAEVMTTSTMVMTGELICVASFVKSRRPRWLIGAALANGLGIAVHQLAALNWPAYVLLLLSLRNTRSDRRRRRDGIREPEQVDSETPIQKESNGGGADQTPDSPGRSRLTPRMLLPCLAAWSLGAAPIIVLLVKVGLHSGNAAGVFYDFWAGRYAHSVFNLTGMLSGLLKFIAYWLLSFPSPVALLAVPGVWIAFRRWDRRWVTFILVAACTHVLFAIRFDVADQHDFYLPAIILFAVILAVGIDEFLRRARGRVIRACVTALPVVAPCVYALAPNLLDGRNLAGFSTSKRDIPGRARLGWFLRPWHCGDRGPEQFARDVLDDLPADAVLAVDSTIMPPILYLQNVRGLRRDVRIVNAGPFQPWIHEPFDLAGPQRDEAVRTGRLFTATDHRAYINARINGPDFQFVPSGSVFRVQSREPAH